MKKRVFFDLSAPKRACSRCGEETQQPEGTLCDECTGTFRICCETCGRQVASVDYQDVLYTPRHKNKDNDWCVGGGEGRGLGSEVAVLN